MLAKTVAARILEHIPVTSMMDAADYGCGTGLLTLEIQPHVRSIIGLDSSAGMMEVLNAKIRERGIENASARILDLETETPEEGQFDLIVSNMTFHHVKDTARLIGKLHTMLRPGGYLAIADLDTENGDFHADKTGIHHFGFDRDALADLFCLGGFKDVRTADVVSFTREVDGKGPQDFSLFLAYGSRAQD
jgi:2-polyprenyl-3-methyl-5-hydroxy-6-metoxy-1,4-benzoquinol methylase